MKQELAEERVVGLRVPGLAGGLLARPQAEAVVDQQEVCGQPRPDKVAGLPDAAAMVARARIRPEWVLRVLLPEVEVEVLAVAEILEAQALQASASSRFHKETRRFS